MNNKILKLLYSIPVILIVSYFIPFLGICLLIFRYIMLSNRTRKRNETPIILIIVSLIILLPRLLNYLYKYTGLNSSSIPFFDKIVNSDLYNVNFINYSKFLFIVSVIFIIVSALINKIFNKSLSTFRNYMAKEDQKDYEIRQKNDLIMQEKREIAKNTRVVKCPHCGAKNTITSSTGTCKYCRNIIN